MRMSCRALASYTVWLASLVAFVTLSGLAWVPLTPRVALCLALLSLVVALLFDRWFVRTLGSSRGWCETASSTISKSANLVILGMCALCGAAYLLLWVPAYCRPDFTWDGMTYHLPTVHFWSERGFVHWIDVPSDAGEDWRKLMALLNGYPKGAEVVAFVLSVVSGGKLVNAPTLVYLPLGIFGLVYVARELGAARAPAALAGLLWIVVPTNVGQATSTYVDTSFASAVVAFAALYFASLRSILVSPTGALPASLGVASGAALGLAIGVKAPGLVLGPMSMVGTLAAVVQRYRRKSMLPRKLGRAVGISVLSGMVALGVGGYWYARNLALADNPMFPVEVKVGEYVVFPGVSVRKQIEEESNTPEFMRSWGTTKRVLYAWAQSGRVEWPVDARVEHDAQGYAVDVPENVVPAWPRSIRYQDARSGGLGFLWLFGAVPSLVAVAVMSIRRWRSSGRISRSSVATLLYFLLVAGLFSTTPMRWWARYTLWLYAVGLPMLAVVLHFACRDVRTPPSQRWKYVALRAWFVVVGVVALFEFGYALKWDQTPSYFVGAPMSYTENSPKQFWRALTTSRDDGRSAIYLDLESANDLVKQALGGASTVAVTGLADGRNDAMLGQLSMPPGARHVVPMGFEVGYDEAVAARFIRTHLPRYVVWDHDLGGDPHVLLATATRWSWFRSFMIFEFGHDPNPPLMLEPK